MDNLYLNVKKCCKKILENTFVNDFSPTSADYVIFF